MRIRPSGGSNGRVGKGWHWKTLERTRFRTRWLGQRDGWGLAVYLRKSWRIEGSCRSKLVYIARNVLVSLPYMWCRVLWCCTHPSLTPGDRWAGRNRLQARSYRWKKLLLDGGEVAGNSIRSQVSIFFSGLPICKREI